MSILSPTTIKDFFDWDSIPIVSKKKKKKVTEFEKKYIGLRKEFLSQCRNKVSSYYETRKEPLKTSKPDFAHYKEKISCPYDWNEISFASSNSQIANIETVKVVIDRNEERIYFLNSFIHEYHFRFYEYVLFQKYLDDSRKNGDEERERKLLEEGTMELREFNKVQYQQENRDYVLLSIHHYLDQKKFCLELWSNDNLSSELLLKYFNLVQRNVYFDLYFHPISNVHLENCPKDIPVIRDLFSEIKHQFLVPGVAFGHLEFCPTGGNFDQFDEESIVFCEDTPLEITPVHGVICNTFLGPLSHVTLLCTNRGTPLLSLINSFNDESLRSLEHEWIKLTITQKDFNIEITTEKEARIWKTEEKKKKKRNQKRILLNTPSTDTQIILFDEKFDHPLSELKAKIGSKADVLLKIRQLDIRKHWFAKRKMKILNGFVLPMGVFLEYKRTKFEDNNKEFIPENIMKDPFDDQQTIELTWHYIQEVFGMNNNEGGKVIFRSSTNVEDIENFNGAGLYDSIVVSLDSNNYYETISKTITKIYCSLVTSKAIRERNYFNIDEQNVSMAILVMPFQKEKVNGVAITHNPYGKNYPSFFINAQKDGVLVTEGGQGGVEQWLLHNVGERNPSCELISYAKQKKKEDGEEEQNTTICSNEALFTLNRLIRRLWRIVQRQYHLDIEFLITEENEIVLLQCRPYTGVIFS